MRVERRQVGPAFEDDERVRVEGTPQDLALPAAGLLLHGAAAVGHGLGELGALPGLCVCGDDETDRHGLLLVCRV
jgi:hypothetical protein